MIDLTRHWESQSAPCLPVCNIKGNNLGKRDCEHTEAEPLQVLHPQWVSRGNREHELSPKGFLKVWGNFHRQTDAWLGTRDTNTFCFSLPAFPQKP